jgi:hypothetical protein
MGTVRIEEALINDIKEYNTISSEIRQHEKFNNLMTLSAPTIADSLYKQLGRNTRWFWEVSKVYDDVNVLIHLCVTVTLCRMNSIVLFRIRKKTPS